MYMHYAIMISLGKKIEHEKHASKTFIKEEEEIRQIIRNSMPDKTKKK